MFATFFHYSALIFSLVHDCSSTDMQTIYANIKCTSFGSFEFGVVWSHLLWCFFVARRVKSKSFPCSSWPPASPFSCGAHLNGAHRTNDPRSSAWCGTVDGYNLFVAGFDSCCFFHWIHTSQVNQEYRLRYIYIDYIYIYHNDSAFEFPLSFH